MNTWTRGMNADIKEEGEMKRRRGGRESRVNWLERGESHLSCMYKRMRYFYTNILSVGYHFIAVPTSRQKPCWNLALELPSEALYQLHTSNLIVLLSNLGQTLPIFSSTFSSMPIWSFYLPPSIVFLNYKLYASLYCLFGLQTSRRQRLDLLNKF